MVKLSFDLNVCKDSSDTDEAAQNGGNPKSVTIKIQHVGCFTPTPSRSYVGGEVSSVNVVDIEEFCLHNLNEIVVKLGYCVANLMYYHFLRPRLGLDYGLHPLNVDADVLEMEKYVKDNKIILVYVEHGSSNVDSSIFVTPKKGVAIAEFEKEWEHVSSKALSIGEVMKILSKKQPISSVEGPIVEETDDPFDGLDEILGGYANIGEEITGKQMIVHVGNSSTVDDVLDYEMLFKTKGVGPIGKFKEVEVDVDNESEEESDIEENDTSGSDSEDLDYDPKHDEVFDDDEHIIKDVHVASDIDMGKNVFSQTKGGPVIIEINISRKHNFLDKDITGKGKKWDAVYDGHNEVAYLMLESITPRLHGQLKNSSPYEMLQELKSMFDKQAGVERNYNMHNMGKTIGELHALLIEYEKGKGKVKGIGKGKGKGKDIPVSIPKPKYPKPSAKSNQKRMMPDTTIKRCLRMKVENQHGKTIKALRLDRGGECISHEFKDYLNACGIVQQHTPPYTPQHNGCLKEGIVLCEIPMEVEGFKPPQKEVVPVRRSETTHRAPDRLCLNVDVEEHSLGDLNEPNNYKAAILDLEFDK
nr:transposase, mutator type [Tanacetum cinerariifolium]